MAEKTTPEDIFRADNDSNKQQSTAVPSQGTTLAYKDASDDNASFAEVANFTDISSFTGSANLVDVTRLNSTGREKKRGMQDWGQVTLALHVNMTEKSHQALFNARKNGTLLEFQLTLSEGTVINFKAHVKDFPIAAKVDQMLTSSVNLEVSGEIVIAFGKKSNSQ